MRQIQKRADGSYAIIETPGGIKVEISDATLVMNINDKKVWQEVKANAGDRAKLKNIIEGKNQWQQL